MDAAANAMEVAVKRQCTEASQDSQQSGYSYDSDDDLVEDSGFAVEAEDSDDDGAGGADSDDEVMDAAALAREQDEAIGRIAGLFDQPRTTAAALLRHFKWREEALMERYFEDSAKVLADAGVGAAAAYVALMGAKGWMPKLLWAGACWFTLMLIASQPSLLEWREAFPSNAWQSHFWGGSILLAFMLGAVVMQRQIAQRLWLRRLHVSINIVVALLLATQAITGTRDLFMR